MVSLAWALIRIRQCTGTLPALTRFWFPAVLDPVTASHSLESDQI